MDSHTEMGGNMSVNINKVYDNLICLYHTDIVVCKSKTLHLTGDEKISSTDQQDSTGAPTSHRRKVRCVLTLLSQFGFNDSHKISSD